MPKTSKPSSRPRRARESKALSHLRDALGLGSADWEKFLWHARNGLADFERRHSGEPESALRIEDVPDEWLEDAEAIGFIAVRVLKKGHAGLGVPVARHFLGMCDLGPDRLCFSPGIGLAWLCLAQHGESPPISAARLAHLALDTPKDFFHGMAEEDLLDLGRLILQARELLEAWDLHALVAAVDRARIHVRAPQRLFQGLMAAEWIPVDVKREFCRGLLGCPPEVQRLDERAQQIHAKLRSARKAGDLIPHIWMEIDRAGLRLMVPSLQRYAVVALVVACGEPARQVVDEFHLRKEKDGYYQEMVHQGALDLIRARADELGPEEVRKLLKNAIKSTSVAARQAAYRIGTELYGVEYARPALKDNAASLRKWAGKVLAATDE